MIKALLLASTLGATPAASAPLEQIRDVYTNCVWSAYITELIVVPNDSRWLMAERSLMSCQAEENLMYSAAIALDVSPQIARMGIDSYKVKLKKDLIEPPPTRPASTLKKR